MPSDTQSMRVHIPPSYSGARASIAKGQVQCVGADLRVGSVGELGRGEIDDDRRPSRREQAPEVALASADVEHRREVLVDDAAGDRCVDVAEGLNIAIAAAPAAGIRVVIGRKRGHQSASRPTMRASTGQV